MSERTIQIKIPLNRIGVLIGSGGYVKKTIEKKLKLKVIVESITGDVTLVSSEPDPSLLFKARDIVLAVGRGFSPEKALKLLNEDLILYIIDLQDFFKSSSNIQRIKSRIIGKNGKTRRILEEETMTYLSIYGNTVSLIGDFEHLEVAKEAIEMLIKGVLHRNVYRFLNKKRSELRKVEMKLWKSMPDIFKEGKQDV